MGRSRVGEALGGIGRAFDGGAVAGLGDADLLDRFVAGRDEEAFAALVGRHGTMVLAACRGLVRDGHDAEDAFQATFLVLARRAESLRVDGSLGGWLHAVACRVARRANRDAIKRWARERRGVDMHAIADRGGDGRGRDGAALHEEIARLPEGMRRAVILCELEGMTQAEAAQALRCGEATVRRRLAGARDRLRVRLAMQGLAPSAVAALLRPATVPAGWPEAVAVAAVTSGRSATTAARLAASVAGGMARARWLRVAATAVIGLASAWGVVAAQQGRGDAPKPAAAPPSKAGPVAVPAGPSPRWAHIKDDVGFESWVRLEDGLDLWKFKDDGSDRAGLRDPTTGTELKYDGEGPIERSTDIVAQVKDGRPDVAFALVRAGVAPLEDREMQPRRATEEERKFERGNVYFEVEVLDGHRLLRKDRYLADSLGKARMDQQTWYDMETRRPVRRREILQLALQRRHRREYSTATIEYVAEGPADLYALGVPAGTPIVDEAALNKVDLPPELRRAFEGVARTIERLPRSCRILIDDDTGLQLTYWTAPEGYLRAWARFIRDSEDKSIYGVAPTRSFFADHQSTRNLGLPDDVPRDLRTGPNSDLLADRIAAWFPFDQSVNLHLYDGSRGFDLTRFVAERGKSRRVQVHVHRDDGAFFLPKPLQEIWPFAFDNRRKLAIVPPGPGTPPGRVAIGVDYGEIRKLYEADPSHDFAIARMVEWSGGGELRFRTESTALRWKQLPGGAWYVSAWEKRVHLDRIDAAGKAEVAQPDQMSVRRIEITPMEPERFPPGIFEGERLLESARKEGAEIRVD